MSYFGTKVFKKIFIMYSFIIVTILVLLSIFVTIIITNTVTNNERFINQKIEQNVSDYFNHNDETSTALLKMLYSNSLEIKDTINFLNYDSEKYLKMRLDAFISMNGQTYDSIDTFISDCFSYNRDVENVIFYSDKNDVLTIYYPVGNCTKIYDVRKKMDKNIKDNISSDILINLVNSSLNLKEDKSYYTIKNLKSPNDFMNRGRLMIRYNLNSINSIFNNYKKYNNTVLILDKEGKTIYDSSNKYTNKKYNFFEKIQSTDKPV